MTRRRTALLLVTALALTACRDPALGPPEGLAYAEASPVYRLGEPVAPNRPTVGGGAVAAFEVSPALPDGLVLDRRTGALSGTPAAEAAPAAYRVTARNARGAATATLTIAVTSQGGLAGAELADVAAAPSPFARTLGLTGRGFGGLAAAGFEIARQPGAASRPVVVTYRRSYLERRGLVSDTALALPVFGLYAGVANPITVTLTFGDGSRRTLATTVVAEPYLDPTGTYASPTALAARQEGDGLAFDYFWIKSTKGAPVIMDSDGQIRWAVATSNLDSVSSVLHQGAFVMGSGTRLIRLELDGQGAALPLQEARYTAFHHDMDVGKLGLLAMLDGTTAGGAPSVESILAELGPAGEVLREWDMAAIFREEMIAGGDDPAGFVRDGADWFHMNSAVYLPGEDALLVSSRENFVVKLDWATGRIRWLFGDPTKHWYVDYPSLRRLAVALPSGFWPIGQHALSAPAPGELLLFNNGRASVNQPADTASGEDRAFSAVSRYRIDDAGLTAVELQRYEAGRALLSMFCSSVYEAHPGHYFVTYSMAGGTEARFVGLLPDATAAFDLSLPTSSCSTAWNARPIALHGLQVE